MLEAAPEGAGSTVFDDPSADSLAEGTREKTLQPSASATLAMAATVCRT